MVLSPPAQRRLACIGDASRFRLVVALAAGERCVTELAIAVGLSQSCTTRHLQALHAAGLVHRLRYGKRVMVALRRDEPELRPLFDYVLALAGERGDATERRPARATAPRPARRPATTSRSGTRSRPQRGVDGLPGEPVESRPGPRGSAPVVEREPATEPPARPRGTPLEDFLL